MKSLRNLCSMPVETESRECKLVIWEGKLRRIEAKMSHDIRCPRCGGKGLSAIAEPAKGSARVWFCVTSECLKIDRDKQIWLKSLK